MIDAVSPPMNRVPSTFAVPFRNASPRLDQKRSYLDALRAKSAPLERCVAPANACKSVCGENKAVRLVYSLGNNVAVKASGFFFALAIATLTVPPSVFAQGAAS